MTSPKKGSGANQPGQSTVQPATGAGGLGGTAAAGAKTSIVPKLKLGNTSK